MYNVCQMFNENSNRLFSLMRESSSTVQVAIYQLNRENAWVYLKTFYLRSDETLERFAKSVSRLYKPVCVITPNSKSVDYVTIEKI